MRFAILGTLEVVGDDGVVELGATKERLVLGLLLAAANTIVSVERLADEVWGSEPPESAVASLRVYVSRLRKALGEADRIVTRPTGYSIRVGPDECDAFQFEALLDRGREELASGRPADASATLRSALTLWRGDALADVCDLPLARAEAVRLEEARLEAVEARIEAELACGRHSALVGELEALVGSHPLREQLWAFRMIALYRSGRQADALRAYQELRRTLADDLGIDPSPALRELEGRILRQELAGPEIVPTGRSDEGQSGDAPPPDRGAGTAVVAASGPAEGAPAVGVGQAVVPGGIVTLLVSELVVEDDRPVPPATHRRHLALLKEAAVEQGGSVRALGEALLAVFGSATQALRAATAAQQASGRESRRTGVPRLALRMGLHVSEPLVDEEDYFDVSVATVRRLCRAAGPGQVLASVVVRDLAGRSTGATFGPGRDLLVSETEDGLEAMPVAELQWPAFEPEVPLPSALEAASGPFVGRRDEWRVLEDCWQTVASGSGVSAVIRGEPGIGKSMLMAEFARHAHRQGATVLYGRCDEEALVPYQPVVEALRHLVHAAPVARLSSHVPAWVGSELVRLVPEAERIGVGGPDRHTEGPPDPEGDRFRLFEAVADLLASMTGDAPVVLAVEDVHWSDHSTELLLRHVARRGSRLPILVVMTLQDETMSGRGTPPLLAELSRDPGLVELRLAGLDQDEVARWIEALVGAALDPDARRVARELHQSTEGNPLYIREILRHLSEIGALVRRGDRTVLARPLDEVGLPDGIREVVDRRLGRLSEDVNQVLVLAAVIGPVFEELVLRRVADDMSAEALFTAIDEALRARIISALPGEPARYVFTHNLVRRTLYERISATRRALLHRRAAAAIEQVHAADPDTWLGQVAYHLAAGAQEGEAARVIEYALRAGDRAMGQLAYEEAAGHYRTAADAASRAKASGGAGSEYGGVDSELESWLRLGDAWWRAGSVNAAQRAYRSAAKLARETDDAEGFARAALGFAFETVGFAGITAGQEQVDLIEEALNRLPDADSPVRVRLLAVLASILIYNEPARQAELAEQAVAMAERIGNADERILARLYQLAGNGPDMPVARQLELADELLALASALEDPSAVLAVHFIRRSRLIWAGQWEAAQEVNRVTATLAEELHADVHRIRPAMHDAMVALLEGRLGDAQTSTQRALELVERSGSEWLLVTAGGQLVLVDFLRGRNVAPLLSAVESISESYANLPVLRCGLAYGYAMAGQTKEARAILEDYGASGFTSVPRTDEWWFCLWMLAQAAVEVEDLEASEVLYDMLLPHADLLVCDGGAWVCLGSMHLVLGALAGALGRFDDALGHLEQADRRNSVIGARPFLAWSAYEQARVLAGRSGPGDGAAAVVRNAVALEAARDMGLDRIGRQARELDDAMAAGAPLPPRAGPETPASS